MSLSLILSCFWVVAATVIAFLPPRINWPLAYGLIALGIPLVGYVTWQNGPVWGLLVLAGGMSMLRWPMIYLGRWAKRRLHGKRPQD